jgi:hypothetical protein
VVAPVKRAAGRLVVAEGEEVQLLHLQMAEPETRGALDWAALEVAARVPGEVAAMMVPLVLRVLHPVVVVVVVAGISAVARAAQGW